MIGETPFIDHAAPVLQNAPITDEQIYGIHFTKPRTQRNWRSIWHLMEPQSLLILI